MRRRGIGLPTLILSSLALVLLIFGGLWFLGGRHRTAPKGVTTTLISADEAKKVALDHAKVKENDTKAVKVEKDREDGSDVYEVEFKTKTSEYDYLIAAKDGKVLKHAHKELPTFKAEKIPSSDASPQQVDADVMTIKEITAIVLADAVLTEDQIDHFNVKLDNENGLQVYEIEFDDILNHLEYEYKIDAKTGQIIARSTEPNS